MNTKVEKLENSMVKLTIEVDAEAFEAGIQKAYLKTRGKINMPGFRKGKAPRKLIEKSYGAGVFYEDAANSIIPDAYDEAVKETGLEVVSRPSIDVEQIESGKPFIFTAEAAVKPEITLGEYKGISVEASEVSVSDEEVDAELKKAQDQNSRIVAVSDRAVQDGDTVNIDFEGFVDGVAFEGGKSEGHELVIGSGSFIDTFEDQLIGKNIGEELEVNVTFPEEYHSEDLAGKVALFNVKINSIQAKELPELDDEFAKDVSEFDTLDEYKADVKENLLKRKQSEADNIKKEKVIEAAIANATIELPDPMVDLEAENMAYEFAQNIQAQGLQLEDYFKYTGQDMSSLQEQMKERAVNKIKSRLVLEAIAAAENIEVSDEDVDAEFERMASMYQMELDKLMANVGDDEKESIKQDLLNKKAFDLIVAEAKEA